jgi:hypothetical protein
VLGAVARTGEPVDADSEHGDEVCQRAPGHAAVEPQTWEMDAADQQQRLEPQLIEIRAIL